MRIFICHSSADDDFGIHLVRDLRQTLGSEDAVWYDSQGGLLGGESWWPTVLREIKSRDIFLVILSPDAMNSEWVHAEVTIAWQQKLSQNEAAKRIVGILYRPCEVRDDLNTLQMISFVAPRPYAEAFDQLLLALHSSRTDSTLPLFTPPGERITGTLTEEPRLTWHMPMRRNPLFTGRETILTLLCEQLTSHRSMALTQVQAISGLGGIGKTQIAVEYAYRYRELYSHVFWVRAATSSDLLADFVSIAQTLTLADGDEPNQYLVAIAVKRWLETHAGWLLILDNADDLSTITNFMPQSTRGHIVLTTRAQATGIVAQALDVEKMDLQEGVLLLLRRAKRLLPGGLQEHVQPLHRAEAEAIVRELDGLPLALDQAGAYIEEKQCSLATYLSLYRTHRKALLLRRSTMPSDHPEPVAATWQLSFRSVEQNQPAAADLLCLCAFLDPDAIPEALLLQGAELGTVLGPIATGIFMLNEAIEELLKYSLVRRNADAQLLSVHRLVQAVLRDEMDATTQSRWMARCIQLLNHIFPAGTMIIEQWEWCEQLVPHVLKSTTFNVQWENSLEAAALFHKTASYLFDRVRYGEAEPLFVHTLHIKERVLGLHHPEVALSLYHLGSLYYEQAKYEEAEPLFVRAQAIWEQAADVDHSQIAYPLNGLADLYYEQGFRN